jgi:hypothetical protein
MKLKIEQLAPYLPYDLGFYVEHANGTRLDNWYMTIDTNLRTVLEFQNKPILRPLSDLTKEIKVDEDVFIPSIEYYYIKDELEELSSLNCSYIRYVRYNVVNVLFELHFDVFGLIEKGLAIDINTL